MQSPALIRAPIARTRVVYGAFWRRLVAYLIDGLIVGAVETTLLVGVALMSPGMVPIDPKDPVYTTAQDASNMLGAIGVCWAITWAYFAILESSPWQATVGKLALGLYVTDIQGDPIGFGRASARFWLKTLSSLPLYTGWILAAIMPRKQALHDLLAQTLVLRKEKVWVDPLENQKQPDEYWDGTAWVRQVASQRRTT